MMLVNIECVKAILFHTLINKAVILLFIYTFFLCKISNCSQLFKTLAISLWRFL